MTLADFCEARTSECTGRPHHRHHIVLRSQGGKDGPTLDVCQPCHHHIHMHPAESYAKGWLMHSWDKPERTTR